MNFRAGILYVLIPVMFSVRVTAQGENNIWIFGVETGLDFNAGAPQYIPSKSHTGEGSASVCDAAGNLLFYTNGNTVWNREHAAMPNGQGLLGNSGGWATRGSATQGVAIVPFIGDSLRYYIFTLDCSEGINFPNQPGYLRYTVVDMSLNGGLGDVADDRKNILLDSGLSEKMAFAYGHDCRSFWMITHTYGSSEFRAFRIDASGIRLPAVSSLCGYYDDWAYADRYSRPSSYMSGEMKVSSDNKQVVLTNNLPLSVELFAFDNVTGMVSDARLIDDDFQLRGSATDGSLYGVSFSPDDSKVYLWPNMGNMGREHSPLLQYDLSLLPDMQAVRRSRMEVGDKGSFGGMRIGPDQKLYITGYNTDTLRRVNYPNLRGNACQVEPLVFPLPMLSYFMINFGLPVPVFRTDHRTRSRDTTVCLYGLVLLHGPPGFDSYVWSDGSTYTSRHVTPPATTWVTCTNACGTLTDTIRVYYKDCENCLFIPEAFTPDGNGLNDVFRIQSSCPLEWFLMRVYNRWGQMVFQSNDIHAGWDGRVNNVPVQNDTYFYYILYIRIGVMHGVREMKKGEITLLR